MEASLREKLPNRSFGVGRISAVGKENSCPSVSDNHLRSSRSPLPAGFPRAPLQDITGVLSSNNAFFGLRRFSAFGKENSCPSINDDAMCSGRSCLSDGFSRAALKEISGVLSQDNTGMDDGSSLNIGSLKPSRKRFKYVDEAEDSTDGLRRDSEIHLSDVEVKVLPDFGTVVENVYMENTSNKIGDGETVLIEQQTVNSLYLEVADDVGEEVRSFLPPSSEIGAAGGSDGGSEIVVEAAGVAGSSVEFQSRKHMKHDLRSGVKKTRKNAEVAPARVGLRSSQEKPKMSSLMKFR
ncbi:hypothetical protein KP509_36G008600 [Ceratopteris richardii]|uniref:Uncharacterized protein n=1 Tax=Ceratopteris richardii TaxID=49495 RepID=A0A8T2QAM4_CERRI|nr:hypothetical protein KP509_36G008600 [Ceratopteris richardii]